MSTAIPCRMRLLGGIIVAAALAVAPPLAASDAAFEVGTIRISEPWARPSPPSARAGAAYMQVHNTGSTDDSLVEAFTPIAAVTELHTHIMDGDVMRMRRVDAIEVPAESLVRLEPGGLHVMLIDLQSPLVEGDSIPLMLRFAEAGEITIHVAVRQPRDGDMSGHGHDAHHDY